MTGYIFAGLGIIFVVLSVCSFKLGWMNWAGRALLVGLTVCILGASGLSFYQSAKRVEKDKENIYLALRFAQDRQSDAALIHLNQVIDANKTVEFLHASGEILLEGMRDNDTMAGLKLRILKETGKYNDDQKDLLTYFENNELSDDSILQNAVKLMTDMLKLKETKEEKFSSYYEIESASVNGHNVQHLLDQYKELYGDDSTDVLELNNDLAGGNKAEALRTVCEMVEDSPSAENRLLLAEVIAEMAYDGEDISDYAFGEELIVQTEKERAKLQESYDKTYAKMEEVQVKLEVATDEKKIAKLTEQKQELYDKCEELMDRIQNIYVYRALNSVADINSLEARVVEARLYYSLGKHDEAINVLVSAADSLAAVFSDNTTLTDGLKLVKKSYGENKGSLSSASEEFSDTVANVLNINSQGMMAVSFSSLSQDFTQKIVSDLKYEDSNIYVLGFDDSNYPEIRVTLGAREDIIKDILEKKNMIAKDTRYAVDYTAEVDDSMETSICFVVDTSGSMSGDPIANVRTAIGSFVSDMDAGRELSLVTFESDAYIRVPTTTDKAAVQAVVSTLTDGGGTNINAGIQVGVQALGDATGLKTMMMLTDGQSDVDMQIVEEAKNAGVTIYTIGFGSVNDALLQEIAEGTGGRYIRAESSNELSSVYNSLGDVIGNTVTITYTVSENADVQPRYFFLRSGNYECSVHYAYREAPEGEKIDYNQVVIERINPQLITMEALSGYIGRGESCPIYISGANLDQITGAKIGDVNCTVEIQSETDAYIQLPEFLREGTYDLTLTTADGETVISREAICIYKEGEVNYNQNYRLGSMRFEASQTVYLASGRMVFSGRIYMLGAEEDDTFRGYTEQLVYLNYDPAHDPWLLEDEWGEYIDLGDSGTFTMEGTIYLDYDDPASGNAGNVVMASGRLEGVCEADQSYISPVED
ncbi:MAG: VWA domain-containing protein [Lachnospiraceae bacterium]|nr:VWA domain-containing protein [Lachnospiraceae bacterium]